MQAVGEPAVVRSNKSGQDAVKSSGEGDLSLLLTKFSKLEENYTTLTKEVFLLPDSLANLSKLNQAAISGMQADSVNRLAIDACCADPKVGTFMSMNDHASASGRLNHSDLNQCIRCKSSRHGDQQVMTQTVNSPR